MEYSAGLKTGDLLYKGSVKSIYESSEDKTKLLFNFSDRYSIFDWGEMPDSIPGKGEALAQMAWQLFNLISNDKKLQIKHHALSKPGTNCLEVQKVCVHKPKLIKSTKLSKISYDYGFYQTKPTSSLVPLEIIFRFGLTQGSSLSERLKDHEYCKACDIDPDLKSGLVLKEPIIEFSTKLESCDRYLNPTEAMEIAGLSSAEFMTLKESTYHLAIFLKKLFEKMNLNLWDGKFEFAFGANNSLQNNREFILIDSIGPDELRLTYDNIPMSKEVLRFFYRGSKWENSIKEAKKISRKRGDDSWQKICLEELNASPVNLSLGQIELSSQLYCALTNELAKHGDQNSLVFDSTPSLCQVASKLRQYL